MITKHEVSMHCKDEYCATCGDRATHKIAEVDQGGLGLRHELVAYVCCRHFNLALRPYSPRGFDAVCELP